MTSHKLKYGLIFGISLLATIIFTILVKVVDVKDLPVYVWETKLESDQLVSVGFASMNEAFQHAIPLNDTLYKISTILGYIALAMGPLALFIVAISQWIKRKNFFKIDFSFFMLLIVYLSTFIFYLIMRKVHINYRPVIMEDKLDESFPSSHTILAIVSISTLIMQLPSICKNKKMVCLLSILGFVIMLIVFFCRMFSGVHWLSDIIGGLLYSATLVSLFSFLLTLKKEENNN